MANMNHLSKKAKQRELAKAKRALPVEAVPEHSEETHHKSTHHVHHKKEKGIKGSIKYFYEHNYKVLLLIPIILLVLAVAQIGLQAAFTGDFVAKATSIKGGQTLTFLTGLELDTDLLEQKIDLAYPANDVDVRTLTSSGVGAGYIVDADFDENVDNTRVIEIFSEQSGIAQSEIEFSVNMIGSSLGDSFFKETIVAILIAFLFMGIVVFLYFKVFIPSLAVVWCAISDIVITLAIFNLFGFKLSTAGIAAFLMLIGYSVDTDILLSTRVLKRKEGSVMDAIYSSIKTGTTMTITTIAAVSVALIVANSAVMQQIMTILLIGLCVDLVITWLQNTALLRWYLEKKGQH